jgi:H+/gluconate symporter-like permease
MTTSTQGFHVDKTISIGHIVTTMSLVVGAFWYFSDLDKRITATEKDIQHLNQQREEDVRRVEKRLDSIDAKLDRLLATNYRGNE